MVILCPVAGVYNPARENDRKDIKENSKMGLNKKSVDDINAKGKRVLVRSEEHTSELQSH